MDDIKNTDKMSVGSHRYRIRQEQAMNLYDCNGRIRNLFNKVDFELKEIEELMGRLDPEIVKFLQFNLDNIRKRFNATITSTENDRQKAFVERDKYKEFEEG